MKGSNADACSRMLNLTQEMAWYDQSNVASLASRMEANVASIRSGIGLKLSMVRLYSRILVEWKS